MIETGVLAKLLQDGLNANTDGVTFKIFADDGQFQKALRNVNTITKFVSGVYTVISSDLLPFKALNMYSITATLDLIVDVENSGKDENGNYVQVEKVKKVLNNYGNTNNGQIFTITGLDYQITAVYNFATVGTEQVLSPLGRCIPIQMWIRYQFVENGVNSNSANIYINGESIPVNIGSITRLRTMTNNNYSGDIATKATGEQNSLSIDITAPLLSTELGKELTKDVLFGGNNKPYIVSIDYNDCAGTYLMSIGNNASNFEINKNVGQKFSLVEIMPELVDLASLNTNGNILFTIEANSSNTKTIILPKNHFEAFISWGDGTGEKVTPQTALVEDGYKYVTHTYSNFEKKNIYIYLKLLQNENIYEQSSGLISLKMGLTAEEQFIYNFNYFTIPQKLGNANITGIANNGFKNFANIKGIDFGETLQTIGESAFENAGNGDEFVYLKFPRTLQTIGASAFERFITLKEFTFEYPLASSLTSIGASAFEDCSWLTNIVLPRSLTSVGADAFKGCSKLENVKVYATTPPTLSDNYLIYYAQRIYIPRGSKNAYLNAQYWNSYPIKFVEFDV